MDSVRVLDRGSPRAATRRDTQPGEGRALAAVPRRVGGGHARDPRRHRGHVLAPRQPLLLVSDDSKPRVRRPVRGTARVRGTRVLAAREPYAGASLDRVGPVGAFLCSGRVRWQLHPVAARSRAERVLRHVRVDSRRGKRARDRYARRRPGEASRQGVPALRWAGSGAPNRCRGCGLRAPLRGRPSRTWRHAGELSLRGPDLFPAPFPQPGPTRWHCRVGADRY